MARHSSRRRIAVAGLLSLTLVLAGCHGTPTTSTSNPAEPGQVAALRALPFGERNVAVVTDALHRAGVDIEADDAGSGSGPVRLMTWQARNLAVEAANDGGIRGDDLSGLAGTPDGAPPLSFLLAAWLTTYDSPAARFAKALMGEHDWHRAEQVRYPGLVLVLFLADATADVAGNGAAGTSTPTAQAAGPAAAPAYRLVAGGPCTTATTFIQNAIVAVANALKVNTAKGGFFGFLGRIWNVAVDLAAGLVKGLIDTVTRPVVNLLVNVFGVVATIAQVTSYLVEWRMSRQAEPEENRFGVDSEVVTGSVTVVVDHDQLPIPEIVLDCADAVGVDLRDAGSTTGSAVIWAAENEGRPDLSTVVRSDDALDQSRSAAYTYRTGQEPADTAQKGEEHSGLLHVTATVQRNDVEKARELFATLLLDQIPQSIRGIVEGYARPILDASTKRLAALTDLSRQIYIAISYHSPATPQTPPPPAGPSQGTPTGTPVRLPDQCPGDGAVSAAVGLGVAFAPPPLHTPDGDTVCLYEAGTGQVEIGFGALSGRSLDDLVKQEMGGQEKKINIPGTDTAYHATYADSDKVELAAGGRWFGLGTPPGVDSVAAIKRLLGIA